VTQRHGPKAKPTLVSVIVRDGDTGARIPDAVVSVRHGRRVGKRTFAVGRRAILPGTAWAPGYEPRTVTFRFDRARRITLSLYRAATQWTMYGADPARTQFHPAIRVRPPFRVVWGRRLDALVEFPAVVADGVAYVSHLHGWLYALSMDTGKTLWSFDMHTFEEDSSPAVVGNLLIAHAKRGRVFVLDRRTGRLLWSWGTAGEVESSPVVIGGVDYLGDWAGNVYALDLRRRRLRWVYHDGCKITASAAISGGSLYLGDYCGRVIALRTANGQLRWSASAGSPVYGTSAVAGGRVFTPSRDSGALVAFTTTGTRLWSVATGALVYSAPAVYGGRVFFGSYNGDLYCVSAASGRVLWTVYAGGRVSGSPTVIDGIVYVGSFGHEIVGADVRTGHVLFRFPHGEYVAVSGNGARLLLYGWSSIWAVEPRR
jgi:outer membrane protein assembly factor BamB